MRFYTVLATAFFLLALANVVAADATGVSFDTTRLAGENSVGERHLRYKEMYQDGDEREDEERGAVRFWIWKKLGRQPGAVCQKYLKYFKGLSMSERLKHPKYMRWMAYKKYFNKGNTVATAA